MKNSSWIDNFKEIRNRNLSFDIQIYKHQMDDAYELAKKRASAAQQQRDEIRETTREINYLKAEMYEIKHLLKDLVGNQ